MKKIFALLIMITILLAACQPTPEKEIVIQRDNTEKRVIEAAKNEQYNAAESIEEPAFQYETPEHVSERFSVVEGKFDILIDADVIMPEIDSVPVAKVKCCPFTQERADELREYFMQGGKLVTSYTRTKEDYDAMIIEAKRGQEVNGGFVFDEGGQSWVDQLIVEREKAPDEDVAILITDYSISGEDGLSGRIIINGEEKGSLYITEKSFGCHGGNSYSLSKQNHYDVNGNFIEMPIIEINMTEQEAIEVAENLLKDLNITGMAVKEMDKVYYYYEYDIQSEPDFGGYYMEFMREFGGMMPINIKGYGMGKEDKFEVSPPVDVERITIAIDESGNVQIFSWRNPIEITEVLTEHVDILPFEDIMTRFRDFSKIQWAYIAGYGGNAMMLKKIYKIELSLIYMPIKNNANEFMYAPCWAFEYKDLAEYTKEHLDRMKENGMSPPCEEEIGEDFLIFSAVDGASVSVYSTERFEENQGMREEAKRG